MKRGPARTEDAIRDKAVPGKSPADGPQLSYLWGDPQDEHPSASLLKLPAGFSGRLLGQGASLRVVVVEGQAVVPQAGETGRVVLTPGSYAGSLGTSDHSISISTDRKCVLYVRTEGTLNVVSGTRK